MRDGPGWKKIATANSLRTPYKIYVGQILKLPFPKQNLPIFTSKVTSQAVRVSLEDTQALFPATPVLFPTFEFTGEFPKGGVQWVTATRGRTCFVKLTNSGTLKIQKKGVIDGGLTLTKDSITKSYLPEAENAILSAIADLQVSFDGKDIFLNTGFSVKVGNEFVKWKLDTQVIGFNKFKGSLSLTSQAVEYDKFLLELSWKLECELHFTEDRGGWKWTNAGGRR